MKRIKFDLNIALGSLELGARDAVTSKYIGRYKSVFKGRGVEFDSYRAYSPDDDAAMIDWKASARADQLMIKQYTEERNLDVFFLIDISNTMLISSQPKLKCEYAAELISSLGYNILESGDNLGYALFNERITQFSPPKKGLSSFPEFIDVLSQADNYGGGCNIKLALDFALESINEGSLVIIVSDFIGLTTGWERSIEHAASKFNLMGIMINDPIERKIPEGQGQMAIEDPLSGKRMLIEPNIIKPFFEVEVKRIEHTIRSVFMDHGADFTLLQTDTDFIGKIIELFQARMAKWK